MDNLPNMLLEHISSNTRARSVLIDAVKRAKYCQFHDYLLRKVPNVKFIGYFNRVPFYSVFVQGIGTVVFNFSTMGYLENGELKILYCVGSNYSIRDMENFLSHYRLNNLLPLAKLLNRQVHVTSVLPENSRKRPDFTNPSTFF